MAADVLSLHGRAALVTGAVLALAVRLPSRLPKPALCRTALPPQPRWCECGFDGDSYARRKRRRASRRLERFDSGADLVDRFVEASGRLDILVNNAGSPIERQRIEACSLDLWRQCWT